jgi:hypothetical protein
MSATNPWGSGGLQGLRGASFDDPTPKGRLGRQHMPFQLKTFVFDEYTIVRLAPTRPGVYGIANSERWIYIGDADNLERVLLRHLHQMEPDIEQRTPTVFTWEQSFPTHRTDKKFALIHELNPLLLTLPSHNSEISLPIEQSQNLIAISKLHST